MSYSFVYLFVGVKMVRLHYRSNIVVMSTIVHRLYVQQVLLFINKTTLLLHTKYRLICCARFLYSDPSVCLFVCHFVGVSGLFCHSINSILSQPIGNFLYLNPEITAPPSILFAVRINDNFNYHRFIHNNNNNNNDDNTKKKGGKHEKSV